MQELRGFQKRAGSKAGRLHSELLCLAGVLASIIFYLMLGYAFCVCFGTSTQGPTVDILTDSDLQCLWTRGSTRWTSLATTLHVRHVCTHPSGHKQVAAMLVVRRDNEDKQQKRMPHAVQRQHSTNRPAPVPDTIL